MSIMVGATSGKFVMVAAMLLFHARVDGDPVSAAIVPGAPVSILSARLARQVHRHGLPDLPVKIGIRGEYFYAPIAAADDETPPKADIVIGQDLLADHPIELDFRRHELASLLPGEFSARTRRDHAVTLTREGPGQWRVELTFPGGGAIDALLDLTSPDAIILGADAGGAVSSSTAAVTLGQARLPGVAIRQAGAGRSRVGLGVFAGRRVILDLAHDRIWVDV
jgi:hypothetical protein